MCTPINHFSLHIKSQELIITNPSSGKPPAPHEKMSSLFLTDRKPSTLRSLIRDRLGKATKKAQKNNENSTSSKKQKQRRRRFPHFKKQSNNNNEKDEMKTVHTSSTTTVNSSNKSESEKKTTTTAACSSSSNLKETSKKSKKKTIVEDDSDEWYASCWKKHQQAEPQPSNSKAPLAFVPFSATEETIDFTLPPETETKKTTKTLTSTKTTSGRRAPKWIITRKEPALKVNCYGHDDDDFILVDLEGEANAAPLEESQHGQPISLLGDLSALH